MSARDEFDRAQILASALDNVIAVGMAEARDGQRELAYGLYEVADKLFGAVRQFDARVKAEDQDGGLSAESYRMRKSALSRLLGLFNAANNCGEGADDERDSGS